MSGFYNNWFKVQHEDVNNNIIPMQSGGLQKPFFFGGSQVPINLGISDNELSGKGIRHYGKVNFRPELKGKGIQSTYHKQHSNIHLPRQMGSLHKDM